MRFNIRHKYTLLIASLVLFLITISFAHIYQHLNRISQSYINSSSQVMDRALLQEIEQRGIIISQILSESLINPIYNYDQSSIRHLIEAYKSDHDVLRIHVFDAEGKIMHDGTSEVSQYGAYLDNRDVVHKVITDRKPATHKHGDHMDFYHPVLLEQTLLGGVHLEMSLSDINRQIEGMKAQLTGIQNMERQKAYQHLLGAAAGLILLSILLAYILASRISIPIIKMAKYAANVGKGNYADRMDYKAKDEIGELSAAFNTMQASLMHSTVSIHELERQVALRTQELADVNRELQLHQEQLELKIAARTAELLETNKCLTEEIEQRKTIQGKLIRAKKMEAVGTLAAGVAHDLNNILTGMVGIPDLILMNLPENSPIRKEILTVKSSGMKAAAVVQDLLNLSRKSIVQNKTFDFLSVLTEYLSSPEHQAILRNHPGVIVDTAIADRQLPILGSRVHAAKALMNLVSNAAEAMPDGGTITISARLQSIDPSAKGHENFRKGDYVVIQVRDSGEGIPPEALKHIFEPFYTTKAMGRSGSGLGLAVVCETMKDHNGYIEVESAVGKGAVFTLFFPATDGASLHKSEKTSSENYRGNGEKVLIIDDQESQRDLLQSIMTRLGYRAHSLPTGEAAVEYLQTHAADLLILDMIMAPGMDGVDTYQEILKIRPRQKAIMVSGYSEIARAQELQSLGVSSYIRKPYTVKQIGLAVRAELDRLPGAGLQ